RRLRPGTRRAFASSSDPSADAALALGTGDVGWRGAARGRSGAPRLHLDERARRVRPVDVRIRVRLPAGARAPDVREALVAAGGAVGPPAAGHAARKAARAARCRLDRGRARADGETFRHASEGLYSRE